MKLVTQAIRAFVMPDDMSAQYKQNAQKPKAEKKKRGFDISGSESVLGHDAWPWPHRQLYIDFETTTDIGQKLRFGFYQLRGHPYKRLMELAKAHKRQIPRDVMDELLEAGIVYNPAICSSKEVETMRVYAAAHDYRFIDIDAFVKDVFFSLDPVKITRNFKHSETVPIMVVGHNLPFDLGALSKRSGPSVRFNFGGLTQWLTESWYEKREGQEFFTPKAPLKTQLNKSDGDPAIADIDDEPLTEQQIAEIQATSNSLFADLSALRELVNHSPIKTTPEPDGPSKIRLTKDEKKTAYIKAFNEWLAQLVHEAFNQWPDTLTRDEYKKLSQYEKEAYRLIGELPGISVKEARFRQAYV